MEGGSLKESLSKVDKYLSGLFSNRDLQGRIPPIEERELARRAGLSRKTTRNFTEAFVKIGCLNVTEQPNWKSRVRVIHVKDESRLKIIWQFARCFRKNRKKKDDICVYPL